MSTIVLKFGGSSLADIEKIKNVAKIILNKKKDFDNIVVVVSAKRGVTENLMKDASFFKNVSPREMDMLLTAGERVSGALMSMALENFGAKAVSLTGSQAGIITDDNHTNARIIEIRPSRVLSFLKQGRIVVVGGFQGVSFKKEVTTLGRGGSDISAVALASALNADRCDIFTDVDGVYTADPRIVPEAKKIPVISYEEMLELAGAGSKVLQIRSVEFAMKYNMPLRVRSTFKPEDEGTLVKEEDDTMEKVLVRGIAHNKNESRLTVVKVPDRPGIAAKLFEELGNNNISVDMIVQNVATDGFTDISFTVDKNDANKAEKLAKKVAQEIGAKDVLRDDKIAKISVVGVGMRSHAGVASKVFNTLAKYGINIYMISTSEIKISVVIDEKFTELAVRVLHEAFELDKSPKDRV